MDTYPSDQFAEQQPEPTIHYPTNDAYPTQEPYQPNPSYGAPQSQQWLPADTSQWPASEGETVQMPYQQGAAGVGTGGGSGSPGLNGRNSRRRRWLIFGGVLAPVILVLGGGIVLAAAHAGSTSAATGTSTITSTVGASAAKKANPLFTVTTISGTTISAKRSDGTSVTIATSSSTIFIEADQKVTISAITVGSHIRVKGKQGKDSSITARKIQIVLPGISGAVTKISGNTISVQGKKHSYTVTVNATTKYYDAQTKQAIALSNIQVGQMVRVVGIKNSANSYTAARITIGMPQSSSGTTPTATP